MKYIGDEATIQDCWIGTNQQDLHTVERGHIKHNVLTPYTKVLDFPEIHELLTNCNCFSKNLLIGSVQFLLRKFDTK